MTIVVGTGPAGLTAAYLLAKRGERVTLVERGSEPGGLWRGFTYNTNEHPVPERVLPPGTSAHVHFETGMHWYTDCGVVEIDDFWRGLEVESVEIPREIAGCWLDGTLQLNSPYPDVRGGRSFENQPVLEKIWGGASAELADGADRLIKIDRVVAFDEERTAALYNAEPESRKHIAWPDQRTLPVEYRSGVSSFYPVKGMRALVRAALRVLTEGYGVQVRIGEWPVPVHDLQETVWAAGLKSAVENMAPGLDWPTDMTPPRHLVLVNAVSVVPPSHDLHYAFDYEAGPRFRVTWYGNFVKDPWRRVSVEMLHGTELHGDEDEAMKEIVRTMVRAGHTILGAHNLGPTLPVPTKHNEARLEQLRQKLTAWAPGVRLIGAGAKAGLFFQPEVLRHVAETLS